MNAKLHQLKLHMPFLCSFSLFVCVYNGCMCVGLCVYHDAHVLVQLQLMQLKAKISILYAIN